jgi:hypothetical protein
LLPSSWLRILLTAESDSGLVPALMLQEGVYVPCRWTVPGWPPILLSETGVPRNANQFANILDLFNGIARYGILGLVWLDERQWRIENSPLAERAFQAGTHGLRRGQP